MTPDGTPATARPPVAARVRAALATPAWRDALTALAASRLLVVAAGMFAAVVFGFSARAEDFDPAGLTIGLGSVGDVVAAPFARWDTVWFLAIAGDGYDGGARAAFFPLYPLLVGAVGTVLGSDLIAGVVVSLVAFTGALVALHRLVALDFGDRVARGAVLAVAFFPMSFFLSAVYSEALYLALSVGAFLAARSGRWAWVGLLGGCAAATRSAGIVLLLPLFIVWWKQRERRTVDLAWLALVPAGLLAYVAGLEIAGLDPLAPFDAQEVWFRSFAGPFVGAWDGAVAAFQGSRQLLSGAREPVYFTAAGGDPYLAARHNIELFAWLVLLLPAVVGVLRRLPIEYGAYLVAALALPLSYPVAPQPLMSFPRFACVLFPLAIWAALWCDGHRWRGRVLLGAGAVGLAVYTGIFATWHWTA
ncbi:MAG: hypothetical protein JHC84_11715 [Solirubrobacteraceae bacterium]|nr:hypothetical protein [Solirubrobacteraceae bacterium]